MYRVTTHWTLLSGRQGTTLLHFVEDEVLTAQDAADGALSLWDALKGAMTTTTVATIDNVVEAIDPVTGALTGLEVVTPGAPVAGTVSGQQAADATQFLIRWTTGEVYEGRRVQGRTYLPGVPVGSIDGGNVKGTVLSSLRSTVADWVDGMDGFRMIVWSRPRPGRPGQQSSITGSDVWDEFAVQRRRRTK